MKTTDYTVFKISVTCPMCAATNTPESWEINNMTRVVKCKYCRREFTFTKKSAKENLKQWKIYLNL